MKKKLIDLCTYFPNSSNDISYYRSLEEKFEIIKVVVPTFSPKISIKENEIAELSDLYTKILQRFKQYLNEEIFLHLSTLDSLTSCIALAMQKEGWEVYAKSLKLDDLTFHTIAAKKELLINTYKVDFPFTSKKF
jgi:hypothetical protein